MIKEKNNLQVTEFNLSRILKEIKNIPSNGGPKFGNEIQELTPQQKKDLMEKVSKFNEYGKVLRCETAIMEMSKTLTEICQMAESYAMTESGDYLQAETVKRDFKEVKGIIKEFGGIAKRTYSELMRLNALYEDAGLKLGRYFEIQSLDEIASSVSNIPSSPAPVVDEVAEEEASEFDQYEN